jgi:hypothetical protein
MQIVIKGYEVLIDDEDADRIMSLKWFVNGNGREHIYFGHRVFEGTNIRLHRFIMGCVKGDGRIVDHINGNTLDNRKSNLRFVTPSQSQCNQHGHRDSLTGLKGVCWDNQKKRWRAGIRSEPYKTRHLGFFATPEEAHQAYAKAALIYHGEYARTE